LGPNGAGKSTTIHLITGLLNRQAGQLQVMGFDPQTQAQQVRKCIGLAAQVTNVYADLSALDNMWHHAALYNDDLKDAAARIESLLQLMELWERRKDAVRTYSGGMKRRLALARALLHNPPVILFDEPTLGVDVQGRHVLWDHIISLKASGKTVVISTNDMNEADKLCDRLAIIDHGKVIALGTPEALKTALNRDVIVMRTMPPIETPADLFSGLDIQSTSRTAPDVLRLEMAQAEARVAEIIQRVGHSHQLESFMVARPTLDDVFLSKTGRALRE